MKKTPEYRAAHADGVAMTLVILTIVLLCVVFLKEFWP